MQLDSNNLIVSTPGFISDNCDYYQVFEGVEKMV